MTKRLVRAGAVLGHAGADSLLMEDGSVAAIGRSAELGVGGIEIVDHRSGVIAPMLHDHHFHPIGYASAVSGLSLKNAVDLDDLTSKLRTAADLLGPNDALIGNRLDEECMTERRLPTRIDLDRAVPERPTLVYRYCGHVAIANTAALRLAGLEGDGILSEEGIAPVSNALAGVQPELKAEAVGRALAGLPSLGLGRITAIVSVGEPLWCGVADETETLLSVAVDLPIDFETLAIASTPLELETAAERLAGGTPNVTFFGWKDFADGSLGGRTAALYEPYSDDPENTGILRFDPDRARLMADACLGLGGTVAIHAIGDRANDQVLDLFEGLISHGADPGRLRIEHASVLTSDSIDRMAALGVSASVQPAFLASEVEWLGRRLGPRVERTYSLEALAAAGVPMVGGSDCPVEPPNPWGGISAAAGPGRLGPQRAIDLFSRPITPGSEANFLVIDRDPITSPEIGSTRVVAAYRHGQPLALVDELPFS
ncbi:MAG: amidohydrolase family protein [Acidimicrobiia bacterium]